MLLIPAASYALSVGSAPSLNEFQGDSQSLSVSEATDEWAKVCYYNIIIECFTLICLCGCAIMITFC